MSVADAFQRPAKPNYGRASASGATVPGGRYSAFGAVDSVPIGAAVTNAMLKLPTFSTVRITKLRPDVDHRVIASSFENPPVPAIGDIGTIVDPTADLTRYLVEKARLDGYTDWLATFAEDELELLE